MNTYLPSQLLVSHSSHHSSWRCTCLSAMFSVLIRHSILTWTSAKTFHTLSKKIYNTCRHELDKGGLLICLSGSMLRGEFLSAFTHVPQKFLH